MDYIQKDRNRLYRGGSPKRVLTALLVAGGLLIPAGECLAALRKGNSERVAGTDEYRASLEVGTPPPPMIAASADGAVAEVSCGLIVVAIVVGNGEALDILSVAPGSYENGASQDDMALLEARLQAEGLYSPPTDDLFFVTFYPPVPVPDPCEYKIVMQYRVVKKKCWTLDGWGGLCKDNSDCGEFGFCLPAEEVVLPAYFVGGGSDAKDLANAAQDPTKGLLNFVGWDEEIPVSGAGAIPTVSSWGVVVMALLVLVGAKTYFGRRKVAPS